MADENKSGEGEKKITQQQLEEHKTSGDLWLLLHGQGERGRAASGSGGGGEGKGAPGELVGVQLTLPCLCFYCLDSLRCV